LKNNETGEPWDSVTVPQPENGTYQEEPKCHKCGCLVSSQWLFCPYCGADLLKFTLTMAASRAD